MVDGGKLRLLMNCNCNFAALGFESSCIECCFLEMLRQHSNRTLPILKHHPRLISICNVASTYFLIDALQSFNSDSVVSSFLFLSIFWEGGDLYIALLSGIL